MKRIDKTVINETKYIALFSLIFSVLMQSVFLVISKWDYTVLLGNVLGYLASVGNFLLMGITVQSAIVKEEKDAKNLMKLSQNLRLLMLFAVAILAYCLPVFNIVAVVIPYIFPRFSITLRGLLIKK